MENEQNFSTLGVIGWSGKFYPCQYGGHEYVESQNPADKPFVRINAIGIYYAEQDRLLFESGVPLAQIVRQLNEGNTPQLYPSPAQFETVMAWCVALNRNFEEMAYRTEWAKYVKW